MIDVIIIAIIASCLCGILYSYIKKIRKGETPGCGCGSSSCSTKSCPSHKET